MSVRIEHGDRLARKERVPRLQHARRAVRRSAVHVAQAAAARVRGGGPRGGQAGGVVLLLHYRSLVQIHHAYVYGGEVKMKDGSMERLPGLHPLHNEL